ncbi:MAG: cytochrome c oxidase assembly protein [Chloroflexota bacterium]
MTLPSVLLRWSFDVPVMAGVLVTALLYWRGWRHLAVVRGARTAPVGRTNVFAFFTGLAIVVIALQSPIDMLGASLFTFHMMQHLLLIMVAAPLLLLGDPAVTMLRGIPLELRRRALGFAVGQPIFHRIGAVLSALNRPLAVFLLFTFDLYLWHWSWLFNLTLRNDSVHIVEHLCFIVTGLLLWSQVIDQPVLHARLSYIQRTVYIAATAAAGNVLAMFFVFTTSPLYAPYAHPVKRLYDMTPVGDQQIAGALMWIPVLFVFGTAAVVCFYKALREDEQQQTIKASAVAAPYKMPY